MRCPYTLMFKFKDNKDKLKKILFFNYFLFDKTFKIISRSRTSNHSYIWYKMYVLYIEYLKKQKRFPL